MQPHVSPCAVRTPRWLFLIGSALIVFHLAAIVSAALAAPSGPWPTPEGTNLAAPPQFAFSLNRELFAPYLRLIHLTAHYHFMTNRPGTPAITLQARVKDSEGKELAVVELPDRQANRWVRHRQAVLASWLAPDQPVQPAGEVVAAPGQAVPTVPVWEPAEAGHLRMQNLPQHLVPRDRPVFRPSDVSLILVRSYARHLCRTHNAASVEIVRLSREAIPPVVLSRETPQGLQEAANTLTSNYGEFSK